MELVYGLAPWLLAAFTGAAALFAGVAATRSPSSRVVAKAQEAIELAEECAGEWRRFKSSIQADLAELKELDERVTRKQRNVSARESRLRGPEPEPNGAGDVEAQRAAARATFRQRGML